MFIVISETPLPDLPGSDKLRGKDNWPVPAEIFQRLTKTTEVRKDAQPAPKQKMTKAENSRGIKLKSSDPAPDFILINRNQKEKRIAVSIQLKHHTN